MLECYYCYDSSFNKSELTGRLTGAEVVDQLSSVSQKWDAENRLPHKKSANSDTWVKGSTPPDLILATNMISVGLDVNRFNTIIMNSMPRNIAEYIQASSRVARDKSGLVITLHNPFRTRDLSHFERFREFHEKLYYYVEPISITPYSKKSVEKYLPLYLATMIRHSYEQLADSPSSLNDALIEAIEADLGNHFKNLLDRTQSLDDEQKNLLTEDLEQNIESFIAQALKKWKLLVDEQTNNDFTLRYSGADLLNNNHRIPGTYRDLFLSLDAYQNEETENMWAVPMSLRNVESEAVIHIKEESNGY
jgi:superfamily II DNA/RNA helicase